MSYPVQDSTPPRPASHQGLVEVYKALFEALPADTSELRRQAHRLRYQVYCIEHKFEDSEDNPAGLERDAYDDHSVQGLLLHRLSKAAVGTVRLVLHKPGARAGSLPFHAVCRHPMAHDRGFLPLDTTFELSRFAISKTVRRRLDDGTYGRLETEEQFANEARRVIPHITLGLMTVALQMGIANGVETVVAVMEPALLRLVARLGFHFETLGPLVAYHGLRQPCYARVATLIEGAAAERPDIWDVVTDRGRLLPRATSIKRDLLQPAWDAHPM